MEFYWVGGTKAGGSMLTGFGGETWDALKRPTILENRSWS
jgi:hypothetical protein